MTVYTTDNAQWSLTNIIAKVRAITGRPDDSQLTDQQIVDYINQYYQYVMPKELKPFWGYHYSSFFTIPYTDTYTPNANYQTFNPEVRCDGHWMEWYIDPDLFFQDYPITINKLVISEGDGVTATFAFQTSAYPIIAGSVYVDDGTGNTAQDNGLGGFLAPYSGSIDYITGAGTVTFPASAIPPANNNVSVSWAPYITARPVGILYFNNTFTVRPIPQLVHRIVMQGITIPTALTVGDVEPTTSQPFVQGSVPYRIDMGPLIAYGASLEIFSNFNQMDQYQQYLPQYLRYKDISMQDTYEEHLYIRSVPKF